LGCGLNLGIHFQKLFVDSVRVVRLDGVVFGELQVYTAYTPAKQSVAN
jgi:hypothetical protein